MVLCTQETSILSPAAASDFSFHGVHGTDARTTPAFPGAPPQAEQPRGSHEDPRALVPIREASRGALPSAHWDPGVAFVLCAEGQEAEYEGRIQFLDKAVVKSVRAAAQGLSEGHIKCRGGVCAAFSEERRQWYVLHTSGSKEAALVCTGRAPQHASPAAAPAIPAAAPGRAVCPAVQAASFCPPSGVRAGSPDPAGPAEPLRTPRMAVVMPSVRSGSVPCAGPRGPSPSPREESGLTPPRGPSPRLSPREGVSPMAPRGTASSGDVSAIVACLQHWSQSALPAGPSLSAPVSARGSLSLAASQKGSPTAPPMSMRATAPVVRRSERGSQHPTVPLLEMLATSPRLQEMRAATPPCLARHATTPTRAATTPASPSSLLSPPVDETFSARYQLPPNSGATGFETPRLVLVPGGHAGASTPQLGQPVQEPGCSASIWLGRERTVTEAMIEQRRISLEQRQMQREQEEDEKQQQQADVLPQQLLQQDTQRSQSMPQQQQQRLQQHEAHELHREELDSCSSTSLQHQQLQQMCHTSNCSSTSLQLATQHQEVPSASPLAEREGSLTPGARPGPEPLGAAGADRVCQQAPAAAAPAAARHGTDSGDFPVVYQLPSSREAASSEPVRSQGPEEASLEEARLRAELREAQEQAQAMREEAIQSAQENVAVRRQLQEALRATQETQVLRERLEQLDPQVREASDLRRQLESAHQAILESKETQAKLEAAQGMAQEVALLRQALDTAQSGARDVEGLRQQLRDEKREFCQHLEKIESVVASLNVRERDLAAKVVELTKENEDLAARLAQKKECQGHSDAGSASTHCGGPPASSSVSSSGGCSGVMAEGSKEQHARDSLKDEVSQKDGTILLLQSKADMAQRKLKLADMENAMLKRQLLALRKLRSDGYDNYPPGSAV